MTLTSVRTIGTAKVAGGVVLLALTIALWPIGLGDWLSKTSGMLHFMLPVVLGLSALLSVFEKHITSMPRLAVAWLGAVVVFLVLEWFFAIPLFTTLIGALALFALSTPFVLLSIGLVEATSGRRFRDVSAAWNRLSEWKQGVLSVLAFLAGLGLVGLILYAIIGAVG